jgi:hypothetical protein
MNVHDHIKNMPLSEQRKHLNELTRLAERHWSACDDNASRLEEGRSILMADMKLRLVEQKVAKSLNAAEDIARASEQWKSYVRKMHDARREANDARADWRATERDYFGAVADERGEIQQMRMSR